MSKTAIMQYESLFSYMSSFHAARAWKMLAKERILGNVQIKSKMFSDFFTWLKILHNKHLCVTQYLKNMKV